MIPCKDRATQSFSHFHLVNAKNVTFIKLCMKAFCLLDPIHVPKIVTIYEASVAFLADIDSCFSKSSFVCYENVAYLDLF